MSSNLFINIGVFMNWEKSMRLLGFHNSKYEVSVYWYGIPCTSVDSYHCFGGTTCFCCV